MSENISSESRLPATLAGDEAVFTCFPRFPPEIRGMIWADASYLPRTISVEEEITYTPEMVGGILINKKGYKLAFSTPFSALLLACQESRVAGLKRQALGFIQNAHVDFFCPIGPFSHAAFLDLWMLCCERHLILALSWEGLLKGPFWKYIYNGMFWFNHLYGELPMVKQIALYNGHLEEGDGLQKLVGPTRFTLGGFMSELEAINHHAVDTMIKTYVDERRDLDHDSDEDEEEDEDEDEGNEEDSFGFGYHGDGEDSYDEDYDGDGEDSYGEESYGYGSDSDGEVSDDEEIEDLRAILEGELAKIKHPEIVMMEVVYQDN